MRTNIVIDVPEWQKQCAVAGAAPNAQGRGYIEITDSKSQAGMSRLRGKVNGHGHLNESPQAHV